MATPQIISTKDAFGTDETSGSGNLVSTKDAFGGSLTTGTQPFSFQQTVKNIPSSAMQFGKNIVNALTHPAETGIGIARAASGGIGKMLPEGTNEYWKEKGVTLTTPEDTQAFDSLKNFFIKRYGSVDALKQTIQNDPVGFSADVSAVMGGAGAIPGKIGKLASEASELANPVNVARGTARLAGEYIGKPVASELEGVSGIHTNKAGALESEFKNPSTILAPGKEKVSSMYESAKTTPINPEFVNTQQNTEFVSKALVSAKAGTLTPEEALAARQAVDNMGGGVNDLYIRNARNIFDEIAKTKFSNQDIAYQKALEAEAMRHVLPINKGGGASIGRSAIAAGGSKYINPFSALAFSPVAQGIAAGTLGVASNAASPIAQLLIEHPGLSDLLSKSDKLGLAGQLNK